MVLLLLGVGGLHPRRLLPRPPLPRRGRSSLPGRAGGRGPRGGPASSRAPAGPPRAGGARRSPSATTGTAGGSAGDPRTPAAWPAWLAARRRPGRGGRREARLPSSPGPDGAPGPGGGRRRGGARGGRPRTSATSSGARRAQRRLGRDRPPGRRRAPPVISVEVGQPAGSRSSTCARGARRARPRSSSSAAPEGERFWDEPLLWWGEVSGPARSTRDRPAARPTVPRHPERHAAHRRCATSSRASAEVDAAVWGALFVFAFLLFDVYLVAALMAVFMIVGLSRAVNRLSRATAAVQRGDFAVRIPVRRRDQVGDLQRSFNADGGQPRDAGGAAARRRRWRRSWRSPATSRRA